MMETPTPRPGRVRWWALRGCLGTLLVFAALAGAMCWRAASFQSRQISLAPATPLDLDKRAMARRLAGALALRTVSVTDAQPEPSATQPFTDLHEYLETTFPRAHRVLQRETWPESGHALLYTWEGTDPTLAPVVLLAHQDVVPVDAEDLARWEHQPFSGDIDGGFVWGRGALDDKEMVLGILEAVEHLAGRQFSPTRTVYLSFGHDEELGGEEGARRIAAVLKERGVKPLLVLDEGMAVVDGIVPGLDRPAALVGIAEKGYLSVELRVRVEGGHSSQPPRHTAIGILSRAVKRLEDTPMPARLSGPVLRMFEYLAPEMGFTERLAFANLWIADGLVRRKLEASPATNATVRTTTAVTMFNAGVKDNVLPAQARAVVNFRILPGDSIASVLEHVRRTVDDDRVRIEKTEKSREPSRVSRVGSPGWKVLHHTIAEIWPEAVVAPALVLGGTDARNFETISDGVYRFIPLLLRKDDLATIHGVGERVSVENYAKLVRSYIRFLENAAGVRD